MNENTEKKEEAKVEEIDVNEVEQVLGGLLYTSYIYPISYSALRLPYRDYTAGNIAWQ
jgi:hypothetical protein